MRPLQVLKGPASYVLIGSWALFYHNRLKDRVPSDYDIIHTGKKTNFSSYEGRFDLISTKSANEPTNKIIYDYCQGIDHRVMTPLGEAIVAPLEILKVLKISSLPLNKIKNEKDLILLEDIFLSPYWAEVATKRTEETLLKIENQKSKFFNKYDIPRFFDHDQLHIFVSNSPKYLSILKNESLTEIDYGKFHLLPFEDQILVLFEEAMVLSLERYLIPKIRKSPMYLDEMVGNFMVTDHSDRPSRKWLNKLCVVGAIQDHPNWLASWGNTNYDELLRRFPSWWERTVEELPESFWEKLLSF